MSLQKELEKLDLEYNSKKQVLNSLNRSTNLINTLLEMENEELVEQKKEFICQHLRDYPLQRQYLEGNVNVSIEN